MLDALLQDGLQASAAEALASAVRSATLSRQLAPVGIPGCFAHLTLEALQILPSVGGVCYYQLSVPASPLLAGFELHLQEAFVPDPSANNGLGGYVTNALRGIVGSR